jgi:hypothetical protein
MSEETAELSEIYFHKFANECKELFNQVCLCGGDHKLWRVIGYGEDRDDSYYIAKNIEGELVWHSMVGFMVGLKDRLTEREYNCFDSCFKYNGCDNEESFLVDIRHDEGFI